LIEVEISEMKKKIISKRKDGNLCAFLHVKVQFFSISNNSYFKNFVFLFYSARSLFKNIQQSL